MLKKSASSVLARHSRLILSPASTNVALIMCRAAALLDGLFEQPRSQLREVLNCRDRVLQPAIRKSEWDGDKTIDEWR